MLVHTLTQGPCEHLLQHFFKEEHDQCWRGLGGKPFPLQDLASEAFSPAAKCIEEYIDLLMFSGPSNVLIRGTVVLVLWSGACGT